MIKKIKNNYGRELPFYDNGGDQLWGIHLGPYLWIEAVVQADTFGEAYRLYLNELAPDGEEVPITPDAGEKIWNDFCLDQRALTEKAQEELARSQMDAYCDWSEDNRYRDGMPTNENLKSNIAEFDSDMEIIRINKERANFLELIFIYDLTTA